mgnify:CR=1 FL=1
MKEIIKIEQKNGIETVNARELHEFLESKQEFSSWIKARIMKYGFEENEDYITIDKVIKRETGGTKIKEYHITIDMAKEISMSEGNEKGKQARKYFIACEKQLKTVKENLPEIIAAEIKRQLKNVKPAKQIEAPKIKIVKEYKIGSAWVKLIEFKGNKFQVMRNFYNNEKCDLRYNDRDYGSIIKAGFITIDQCFKYIERNL